MIDLIKCSSDDISLDDLNRLYNEAYPYISQERARMGEEALKNELIHNLQGFPLLKYQIEEYIVGICSYTSFRYNDKVYLFHRHPLYGNDSNGSRSWWYSEEFQKKNSEFVRSENFAGVMTLYNPNSPAAKAVANHFGSFGKYYVSPISIEPTEINIALKPDAQQLKAFIINLKE